MTIDITNPRCVCGKKAITTIVGFLACADCHAKYTEEGRKYLPDRERVFYNQFVADSENKGRHDDKLPHDQTKPTTAL